ncbi:MAG: GrpB family protein [Betaproteobacteria bacterium]
MQDAKVEVFPYLPEWPGQFESEARVLRSVLAPWLIGDIEHIGSTAVAGLSAKPVIDIMASIRSLQEARSAIDALARLNYVHFPYKQDEMHWLCKPSPSLRTHHLHLVPAGSDLWHSRLAFRDALRRQPTLAAEYTQLKAKLAAAHPYDREAYTEGKSAFIQGVLTAVARSAA